MNSGFNLAIGPYTLQEKPLFSASSFKREYLSTCGTFFFPELEYMNHYMTLDVFLPL